MCHQFEPACMHAQGHVARKMTHSVVNSQPLLGSLTFAFHEAQSIRRCLHHHKALSVSPRVLCLNYSLQICTSKAGTASISEHILVLQVHQPKLMLKVLTPLHARQHVRCNTSLPMKAATGAVASLCKTKLQASALQRYVAAGHALHHLVRLSTQCVLG